ncbi:Uncharacterised protein [Candidatus Anstonella stagnisolia]|nr:Uncharacterised protein [Candidatus Anstonella stagnisolia]
MGTESEGSEKGASMFEWIARAYSGRVAVPSLAATAANLYGVLKIMDAGAALSRVLMVGDIAPTLFVIGRELEILGTLVFGIGLVTVRGISKKTAEAYECVKTSNCVLQAQPQAQAVLEHVAKSAKSLRIFGLCIASGILLNISSCVVDMCAPQVEFRIIKPEKEEQKEEKIKEQQNNAKNILTGMEQKEGGKKMEILRARKAAFEKYAGERYPQRPYVQRMQAQRI